MPEEGRVGIVSVTFLDGSEQMLEGDYSALTLSANQKRNYVSDEEEVEGLFGDAVAALPAAPYHAKLYFLLDKDELTPESKTKAKAVFDEIIRRQAAEIAIVGHTDTAASYSYNQALSLRRAMKVREALIALGVPANIIETSGQGEYQLLIETPDNTPEPRNRRVEIDVR
ncbi:MAG: OmpA family protein [Methylophaga sp.]|nr:OmpA family protein [Methylophaga sp.]